MSLRSLSYPTGFALLLCGLLSVACVSHDPLYHSEADIPGPVLVSAGESRAPEDSAALVLLADLAVHHPDWTPDPETLATVLEALGTRWVHDALGEVHAGLAIASARALALDDERDVAVRMNACDLLSIAGDGDTLRQVASTALDPLVAEHALEALERSERSGPSR